MCGIVGYVGTGEPLQAVLDGLRCLEYRGYDSAGVAYQLGEKLNLVRSVGRVDRLAKKIPAGAQACQLAIGHTRWATHGKPSEVNAHPHTDSLGQIALVHNGIIENYAALKKALEAEGSSFKSDTDSEVIAKLIGKYYQGDLTLAVERVMAELDGTFALAVVAAAQPGCIVGARRGSPLAVGFAEKAMLLASDLMPIIPFTKKVKFLEDEQVVVLRPGGAELRRGGKRLEAVPVEISWDQETAEKNGYPHYMLKEIHEQPAMLERLVRARILDPGDGGDPGTPPGFNFKGVNLDENYLKQISRIVFIAQGSAYHAAMIGRNMIERTARIPCLAEYASDFRYRDPILDPTVLVIAVSQSGETLDTLEAVRFARAAGCRVLGIVNVSNSAIARESDDIFYMNMGPEIGVASTKAFTGMLASLYLLAIHFGVSRETLLPAEARRRVVDLTGVGTHCEAILANAESIRQIALRYQDSANAIFLGRGTGWPLAMEGALKLKEVSYIHAEAYNAAEMKHGPIAIVDENMPVCVIALKGRRYNLVLGNIQEVKARGGRVIAIASHDDEYLTTLADDVIHIRAESGIMNSILGALPLQLLAYYIAEARGCDIDKPRNLAKCVTVK